MKYSQIHVLSNMKLNIHEQEVLSKMNNYKIGFIGSGKMAGAIIKGLIRAGFTTPYNIIATQLEQDGL